MPGAGRPEGLPCWEGRRAPPSRLSPLGAALGLCPWLALTSSPLANPDCLWGSAQMQPLGDHPERVPNQPTAGGPSLAPPRTPLSRRRGQLQEQRHLIRMYCEKHCWGQNSSSYSVATADSTPSRKRPFPGLLSLDGKWVPGAGAHRGLPARRPSPPSSLQLILQLLSFPRWSSGELPSQPSSCGPPLRPPTQPGEGGERLRVAGRAGRPKASHRCRCHPRRRVGNEGCGPTERRAVSPLGRV